MVENRYFIAMLDALTESLKKIVELQKELDDLKHSVGNRRRKSISTSRNEQA